MPLKFNGNILNTDRWTPPTGREAFIKLDLNESYALFSNNFLNKYKSFNNFVISGYPEYDKLLKLLSSYSHQPVKNIVLTNGGDQAIELLLRLFLNDETTVLMPSPVFSIYDHILQLLNIRVKHISYIKSTNYFSFPINEVYDNLSKSNCLILCNPNNPLGSSINEADLLALVSKTNELNIPCIIDEAYFEFYGQTAAELINKYSNLIIIRTFSKMFGLAGLRLGYILANKPVIDQLLKIRGPWDVNHFAVFAAEIALNNLTYFLKRIETILKFRTELESLLVKNSFQFFKTHTNFSVIKSDGKADFIKKLQKQNILINDISNYPFHFGLLRNTVRITIPGNQKDFETFKTVLLNQS